MYQDLSIRENIFPITNSQHDVDKMAKHQKNSPAHILGLMSEKNLIFEYTNMKLHESILIMRQHWISFFFSPLQDILNFMFPDPSGLRRFQVGLVISSTSALRIQEQC